jgi:hypothetical protein
MLAQYFEVEKVFSLGLIEQLSSKVLIKSGIIDKKSWDKVA